MQRHGGKFLIKDALIRSRVENRRSNQQAKVQFKETNKLSYQGTKTRNSQGNNVDCSLERRDDLAQEEKNTGDKIRTRPQNKRETQNERH